MKRTTYAIRGNSKYSIEIPAQPSKLKGRVSYQRDRWELKNYYWYRKEDNSLNTSEGEE